MSKSLFRTAAAGALLAFAATPALAQAATPSVVVVNVARIFQDSAAGKYALAQLQPQADQLNVRAKNYQDKFQKEGAALQQAQSAKTLTPPVIQQRAQELDRQVQTANQDVQTRQRALQATDNAWKQQVLDAMNPIVMAIMKQRGAVVAIPTSVTLQVSTTVDITPDVLSQLDRTRPRVNLTAPAAAPAAR